MELDPIPSPAIKKTLAPPPLPPPHFTRKEGAYFQLHSQVAFHFLPSRMEQSAYPKHRLSNNSSNSICCLGMYTHERIYTCAGNTYVPCPNGN